VSIKNVTKVCIKMEYQFNVNILSVTRDKVHCRVFFLNQVIIFNNVKSRHF